MRYATILGTTGAVGLSLVLALGACSRRETEPGTTRTTGASPEKPTATQTQTAPKSDADITMNVEHSIKEDTSISPESKNVQVVTRGGMVTLRGQVKDQRERDAIAMKVRQLPGVTGVDNQLEVKGGGKMEPKPEHRPMKK